MPLKTGKSKEAVNYNIKELIVMKPKIIVVPILKNVDETIAGTINNKEKGFEIPPVKYNNKLS